MRLHNLNLSYLWLLLSILELLHFTPSTVQTLPTRPFLFLRSFSSPARDQTMPRPGCLILLCAARWLWADTPQSMSCSCHCLGSRVPRREDDYQLEKVKGMRQYEANSLDRLLVWWLLTSIEDARLSLTNKNKTRSWAKTLPQRKLGSISEYL